MMKIIAVSGGVDSMTLLHMKRFEKICVVHINHHTRKEENTREEQLVKKFCLDNDIPFVKFDFYYSKTGNFQKEAREFRYRKFKEVAELNNAQTVYLAHHFDDQIENILMFSKKIGPKMMKKIEVIDCLNIERPLLGKTKQQLYKYATINNVDYLEDSSNISTKYSRNLIRDKLKKYTYEQKQELYTKEYERQEKIEELINYYKSKKEIKLQDIKIDSLNIYSYLKSQNIKSNISKNKIELIIKFLNNNKNGKISIDKDYVLLNSYNIIKIQKNKPHDKLDSQKIKVSENKEYIFNNIIGISKIDGYVRATKPGDKLNLKNGSKKISRYFIDEKIPRDLRKSWPIFLNEKEEIVYIPKPHEVQLKEQNES